jgi:hypothetical protein
MEKTLFWIKGAGGRQETEAGALPRGTSQNLQPTPII